MSQDTTVDACAASCAPALALIADTPLTPDIDAIDECRDAVSDASCQALANQSLAGMPACEQLYRGTLAEGAGCTFAAVGDPCGDGLECSVTEEGVCGTCIRVPESCVEGDCPSGHYCSISGRCVASRSLGETCERMPLYWSLWDRTCDDGTFCGWQDADDHGPPRCRPQVAAGEMCRSETYSCQNGLACIRGACEPSRGLGETCDTFSDCNPGLTCTGTCVERRAEGDTCDAWVGACGPGLGCEGGRCAPASPNGPGGPPADHPVLAAGARCDQGTGICPLGTACLCTDPTTCPTMTCSPGPGLGESCAPVFVPDEAGGGLREDPFNPYACSEGYCDFIATRTCVVPQGEGGACDFEGLTATLQCSSLLCEHRRCRGIVDPECR